MVTDFRIGSYDDNAQSILDGRASMFRRDDRARETPCPFVRDFGGGPVKAAMQGRPAEDGIAKEAEGETGADVRRRREWVGAPVIRINLFRRSGVGAEECRELLD